jgi:hypothetical protein
MASQRRVIDMAVERRREAARRALFDSIDDIFVSIVDEACAMGVRRKR